MHDLTGFKRDILFIMADLDQPKGLRIKDELETYYEGEINHGRLYPNLDDLVDKGLLTKEEADGRTNAYSLTRRGERVVKDRLAWEQSQLEASELAPEP